MNQPRVENQELKVGVISQHQLEPKGRPEKDRLVQIDGLRGIAMCFVFLGHFAGVWHPLVDSQGAARLYLRIVDADATFGSSFFMLIFAFFAYGSMRRGRRPFGEFIAGRLWRLYPLYLVMVALYIAGSVLLPHMSKLPADRGEWPLYLLQTVLLLPGIVPAKPLMDVSWTLSFIVLFYFVEAALANIFRSSKVRPAGRMLFFCGMALLWALAGDIRHWWEPRTAILWTGMALSEFVDWASIKHHDWAARMVIPAVGLFVFGGLLRTELMLTLPSTPLVSLEIWRFGITSVTLSALTWVCYFGPDAWTRVFTAWPLLLMGEANYSYYLTHGIAIKLFRFGIIPAMGVYASNGLFFWISQLGGIALSVAIATLVHRHVDLPLARLGPLKRPKPAIP